MDDPLIHHRRHFGRTVHAMCSLQVLITNTLVCLSMEEEVTEERHTFKSVYVFLVSTTRWLMSPSQHRERMEIQIFNKLSWMVPGIVDRIVNSGPAEAMDLADLVCSCGLSSYHSLIFERLRRVW